MRHPKIMDIYILSLNIQGKNFLAPSMFPQRRGVDILSVEYSRRLVSLAVNPVRPR